MSSNAGGSRLLSQTVGSKSGPAQSTYSGTAGKRGGSRETSKSRRKENVLGSLALGVIPMEGNADLLNVSKPATDSFTSVLNRFLEMRTSTRMKREMYVKKRREELLKLCTPEL